MFWKIHKTHFWCFEFLKTFLLKKWVRYETEKWFSKLIWEIKPIQGLFLSRKKVVMPMGTFKARQKLTPQTQAFCLQMWTLKSYHVQEFVWIKDSVRDRKKKLENLMIWDWVLLGLSFSGEREREREKKKEMKLFSVLLNSWIVCWIL